MAITATHKTQIDFEPRFKSLQASAMQLTGDETKADFVKSGLESIFECLQSSYSERDRWLLTLEEIIKSPQSDPHALVEAAQKVVVQHQVREPEMFGFYVTNCTRGLNSAGMMMGPEHFEPFLSLCRFRDPISALSIGLGLQQDAHQEANPVVRLLKGCQAYPQYTSDTFSALSSFYEKLAEGNVGTSYPSLLFVAARYIAANRHDQALEQINTLAEVLIKSPVGTSNLCRSALVAVESSVTQPGTPEELFSLIEATSDSLQRALENLRNQGLSRIELAEEALFSIAPHYFKVTGFFSGQHEKTLGSPEEAPAAGVHVATRSQEDISAANPVDDLVRIAVAAVRLTTFLGKENYGLHHQGEYYANGFLSNLNHYDPQYSAGHFISLASEVQQCAIRNGFPNPQLFTRQILNGLIISIIQDPNLVQDEIPKFIRSFTGFIDELYKQMKRWDQQGSPSASERQVRQIALGLIHYQKAELVKSLPAFRQLLEEINCWIKESSQKDLVMQVFPKASLNRGGAKEPYYKDCEPGLICALAPRARAEANITKLIKLLETQSAFKWNIPKLIQFLEYEARKAPEPKKLADQELKAGFGEGWQLSAEKAEFFFASSKTLKLGQLAYRRLKSLWKLYREAINS